MLNRKLPPQIGQLHDFVLKKPESFTLANGAKVFITRDTKLPVCSLQLMFKAGKWYEKVPNTASLTAKMMGEGTEAYSSKHLNNLFSKHGAFWEVNTGFDLLNLDVYCLSRHLSAINEAVYQMVHCATFPDPELESLKRRAVQQLKVNQQRNSYLASSLFRSTLYGPDHPYGYTPTPEAVAGLSREPIEMFYRNHVAGKRFDLLLSGDIRDEHLKELDAVLGQIEFSETDTAVPIPAAEKAIEKAPIYRPKESAVQTSIRIGKPIVGRQHPDATALEVLNEILGGYFGSRLMSNLREKKGLTYGIYSSMAHFKHHSHFVIGTDTTKEKRDEALGEIYKEIRTLCEEPVPEAELALVKNFMGGNYMKGINTPLAIAEHFKSLYFMDMPLDWYDTYVSKVQAITAEQVQAMAQQYLNDDFVEVMVG